MLYFKFTFFFKITLTILSLLFLQHENMLPFSWVIYKHLLNVIKSRFLYLSWLVISNYINIVGIRATGTKSDYVLPISGYTNMSSNKIMKNFESLTLILQSVLQWGLLQHLNYVYLHTEFFSKVTKKLLYCQNRFFFYDFLYFCCFSYFVTNGIKYT